MQDDDPDAEGDLTYSENDEVVVECDTGQAEDVRIWLETAMVEGLDAVLNRNSQMRVPVEVGSRVAGGWGEE